MNGHKVYKYRGESRISSIDWSNCVWEMEFIYICAELEFVIGFERKKLTGNDMLFLLLRFRLKRLSLRPKIVVFIKK